MKAVAYLKYNEWKDDAKMASFIKPDTIFRPKNFQKYLAEVEIKKPKWNIVSTDDQRKIIKELNSYGVKGECNEETDALAKKLIKTGYNKKDFLNLYLLEKI
jgi:hypothetical protein